MRTLEIYTDGGCRNNQSKDKSKVVGGWGTVLKCGDREKELYGGKMGNTTNNEMELTALLMAFQSIKNFNMPTIVYVDSEYTMNCMTKWIAGWEKKGWRTASNKPVANKFLLQNIYELYKEFTDIKFVWVKGHADNPGNIRADALANKGMDEVSQTV